MAKNLLMDWQFENYDKEMLMGLIKSPQSEFLQNCDLPPPLKVFSPAVTTEFEKPVNNLPPTPGKKTNNFRMEQEIGEEKLNLRDGENAGLLRALHLSQTRAREAEKKAASASTKIEKMTALLIDESIKIYAHKQWMKLLEAQISLLNRRLALNKERDEEAEVPSSWCWTYALCLGIAGVGLVISRYIT